MYAVTRTEDGYIAVELDLGLGEPVPASVVVIVRHKREADWIAQTLNTAKRKRSEHNG